jgi:hypothetical protein
MPATRLWVVALSTVVLLLLCAQLVPYGSGRVNPPVVMEPSWDTPGTRTLAKQGCFDCHSNETVWPAYARVAPVSWLIQRDVDEGRAALNFSEWQRPQKEAGEAADVLLKGEMPPRIYLLMHAHARLGDADRDRLASGLAVTLGSSHAEGATR